MIFDNVVRNWLALTVEDKLVDHEGLGFVVGRCLGPFYADDGMVGSRYLEWIQGAPNLLIRIFRQYGMVANVAKYRAMTCQTG